MMSAGTDYEFEWDDTKAERNLTKHGVDFMDAMSVLLDPLAMTRFDDKHADEEEAGSVWGVPPMGSCC